VATLLLDAKAGITDVQTDKALGINALIVEEAVHLVPLRDRQVKGRRCVVQ
jgi:hypothetical protein